MICVQETHLHKGDKTGEDIGSFYSILISHNYVNKIV